MENREPLNPVELRKLQLDVFKENSLFILICNNAVIEVSDRIVKLLGYEKAEDMPEMFPQLLPESRPREFLVYHKLFLNKSYRTNYDMTLAGNDGQLHTLRFVAKQLVASNSETLVILIGEDVSYQRRRLDELTLATGLFSFNPYSIVITDNQGIIEKVNPKFKKRTLYSEEAIKGKSIFNFKSIPGRSPEAVIGIILSQTEFRGEFRSIRADGSQFDEELYVIPLYDYGELKRLLFIGDDITHQRNHLLSLEQRANYDDLTGLLLRDVGTSLLYEVMENDEAFGILFIDLQNFKNVNDTFGHSLGDDCLVEVSKRLENSLRQNDLLIRWGSDEFVVVTVSLNGQRDLESIAVKLKMVFNMPFVFGEIRIGADIGGCYVPPDCSVSVKDTIRYASENMYEAKQCGKTFIVSAVAGHSDGH